MEDGRLTGSTAACLVFGAHRAFIASLVRPPPVTGMQTSTPPSPSPIRAITGMNPTLQHLASLSWPRLSGWPFISRHYPHERKERRKIESPHRKACEVHPGQQYHEPHESHPLVGNCRQQCRPEHHDLKHDKSSGVIRLVHADHCCGNAIGHSGHCRWHEWI